MRNACTHSHRTYPAIAAAAFVLLIGLSAIAFAQTTISTGSIQGIVTDPSGAIVGGAAITITNTATGQAIKTSSNTAGVYTSGALSPGRYTVKVEAKGFKAAQLDLTVQVNNTVGGNVRMQLGQASEVVEVQGSQVQVNTEQAEVQGVLTAQQIENLPVNGRNFLDLAQLEPGVQIQDGVNFDPTKVGFSSISFGGRFGRTARIEVDGVDVSDETVGTTTEDIPASAIQEFSIAQSSLDLSNDLTTSGAVNVVTKYGTNNIHGEAYGQFRDSGVASAALPGVSGISSPFQRNQEGGNIGGPIIKDKLFFFADGERTLQHLQAPVDTAPFDQFSGAFSAPFHENELLGRLDYQLTKKVRVFDRFSYFQNSTFATFFPSSFQVYDNRNYTRQDVAGVDFNTGQYTHSIRFSYLKFQNNIYDATVGTNLPLANFPVSLNIGPLSTGPNFLAPQATPQSDHQLKYDGSKPIGKHILRYGISWNHIQGGGFASFNSITPQVNSDPSQCPDSNPLDCTFSSVTIGNGQGFSTEKPAFGYPAGGLGPDNRLGAYIGDTWKVLPNLTVSPGLRYVRDTGRTDSDLASDPALNSFFPGEGDRVHQANLNFAPQLGVAWDPRNNGKTVIRAGAGLFYDNVIYNNILFDRPLRLADGAFLATPTACQGGLPQAVPVSGGSISLGNDPATGVNYCAETIGQAASALAAFQAQYQALSPFNLSTPNPNYIDALLAGGFDIPVGLFAPNYKTPRSVQMNVGFQHEIRPGTVLTVDFVRNVETHSLLAVDINHVGDVRYFNMAGAIQAINNTNAAFGCGPGQAGISCAIKAGATMADYAGNGLGTTTDAGGAGVGPNSFCPPAGCAFGGINPDLGQVPLLEPVGRSTYDGLQMKLTQNVRNPLRGIKAANFQIAYSLSRFDNPLAFQGFSPPSPASGSNDQDFVVSAADNNNPLRYFGPSLLDRTHQLSFGGYFDVPKGFRFGLIAHFDSPLSSPVIVGNTGLAGDIFRTDFTGSGVTSDPLPGTTNGSFGRGLGVDGLNGLINNYNATQGNQPTPAGQALINAGLFTVAQLQALYGVAPPICTAAYSPQGCITLAPNNQLPFTWLKTADLRLSWVHKFKERVTIEPSLAFFNAFNFANYNLPPGTENGWLNAGASSINSTPKGTTTAQSFRVGLGTGVYALGAPRVAEWGMKVTF